jgi:hypothetical protein
MSREYLIEQVARDLGALDFDPYPLPYEGRVGDLPPGFLPVSNTINRTRTRTAVFITGRRAGEPVGFSTMWTILSQPVIGIPIPLWVAARSVPAELRDLPSASLCDVGLNLWEYVYSDKDEPNALNSYHVAEIENALAPVKQQIYAATEREMRAWGATLPDSSRLAGFEHEMAASALTAGVAQLTPRSPTEPVTQAPAVLQVTSDPRAGFVEVSFPGDPGNRSLSFYSTAGRRLARFDLSNCRQPGRCSIRWQPPGLPSGLYLVNLSKGSERRTKAFAYLNR